MRTVLIAFFAFAVFFVSTKADECGQNEEFLECQPCVAFSCGEPAPDACITICRNAGCYCREGFLRNNVAACIPESEC
ncbi:hypothetical protein NQ314_004076 [Rhamnusium bicolor]|uniref:TIL domain-containing protein n=1 Tax=Rhamnusium bicolor TaxID=1586634 RepID=A0AAV8ZMJ5_9CUCU|nr:hypothetical protein NQ314_004076 [Rhamnusium bicolor]